MSFVCFSSAFFTSRYFLFSLFFCIFVLSALIRFKPIYEGAFPFLYDHGRDLLVVRSIVVDHKLTLIGPTTGLPGVFHGPLHYYILAVGYIFSNGHPASGVVLTVLFQLAGGIACFYIGVRLFSPLFGFFLSLFYLLSIGSIQSSIMFWNPNWIPSFLVLFYFSLIYALRTDRRYFLLSGFLGGLIAQFEIAFGAFLVPFMFFAGLFSLPAWWRDKYFLSSFFVFCVPFLPFVLFDLRHDFLIFKSISAYATGSSSLPGDYIPLATRFLHRWTELERATILALSHNPIVSWIFFINFDRLLCMYLSHNPIVSWIFFCFIVFYMLLILWKKYFFEIPKLGFFLLLPVLLFFGFMLYPRPAWSYYWSSLQVSYYFLVAYVCVRLFYFQFLFRFIVIIACCLFVVVAAQALLGGTSHIAKEPGIYINMLRVIDTIFEDAGNQPFGLWVYTPPLHDYAYRYIYEWRGKGKNYIPTQRTDIVYYLIIEENAVHPDSPIAWRRDLVGSRSVIWSRQFPGNILVEKIAHE